MNGDGNYLTFTAITDFQVMFKSAVSKEDYSVILNTLQYSVDDGNTWVQLQDSTYTPLITTGNSIMFKGNCVVGYDVEYEDSIGRFAQDTASGSFEVSGNIMSLLFGDNFANKTSLVGYVSFGFKLFASLPITDASKLTLPATTLADGCYNRMFNGCGSLTSTPELPATTLAMGCYFYMFNGCTSLTTAPELPARTLVTNCYTGMFRNCTKLNYIKCLATDISANNCTTSWVYGVASSGTFYKNSSMFESTWGRGVNGIPGNWSIYNVNS